MTKNSLEIGKILVPDQDAANRLKRTLIQSADSASTRRNRQHFWKKFKEWCEARDASPLPAEPDTVVFYLLNQSIVQHLLQALRCPLVKQLPVRDHYIETSDLNALFNQSVPCRLHWNRKAGQEIDLQSAGNSLGIISLCYNLKKRVV